MEPNKPAESARVTKQHLDLERPRPGRPSSPWPPSGTAARATVKKDIVPMTTEETTKLEDTADETPRAGGDHLSGED